MDGLPAERPLPVGTLKTGEHKLVLRPSAATRGQVLAISVEGASSGYDSYSTVTLEVNTASGWWEIYLMHLGTTPSAAVDFTIKEGVAGTGTSMRSHWFVRVPRVPIGEYRIRDDLFHWKGTLRGSLANTLTLYARLHVAAEG